MPETKQRNGIRVFHGFDALPHFVHPAVTVGSYDGVHRGHRALIERLVAEARAAGGESIVLTFEPHPRITLGRGEGLRLLTTLDEKIALLGDLGVDNVIVIPFDRARLRRACGDGPFESRESGAVHGRRRARQFNADPPVAGRGKDRGSRPSKRRPLKKRALGRLILTCVAKLKTNK